MKALRTLARGAVVIAVLVVAATAFAAEVSRAEYREAAEPICKLNTKANERILGGVKAEVRGGKLKTAAAKFARAATALKETQRQLEALPRPAADRARLSKWFAYVSSEVSYFEAIANKLRAGKKGAAEQYVSRLSVTATQANSAVLPFEFDYCRFEPSRFT
jgi:hypothetical protein